MIAAASGHGHLRLERITKSFGGIQALRGVDFQLSRPGVVHGLIGANGSGKSTLLGILSGQLMPDSGTMTLAGESTTFRTPADALRQGISMVTQETTLVPHLSVAENIFLGRRMERSWSGVDWKSTQRHATAVLARLNLDYDPRIEVSRLRPDQQQMVEVARALSMKSSVLILDEPTSSLNEDEVRSLFAAVRKLKTQGISTIFVSHRLAELFELSDEITVLRDGRRVASGPAGSFDDALLVEAMVGHGGPGVPDPSRSRTAGKRVPRVTVDFAKSLGAFDAVNLTIGQGEIVGLAGLTGSGRSELLEAIFGLRRVEGTITIDNSPLVPRSPRHAISAGVGFLPPNRKLDGVVLQRSVFENLATVTTLERPRLDSPRKADKTRAAALLRSMSVKAPHLSAPVSSLSGGNQQKVAIGKWLAASRIVLLLDEPTRGVDIAAKGEIHALLREAAAGGTALLVSSSDMVELIALCDRILVMHAGRVVADVSASEATESTITHLAGGHF